MKKIISAILAITVGVMSTSIAFAGELDTLQTIEKSGGNIQVGSMLALDINNEALDSTSNLITSEVNGVTPEIDNEKYEVISKYVKSSLQDVIGNEIMFNSGVTLSFNGVDSSVDNPVVIFNDGENNIEQDGEYDSNVNILTLKNISNINGVFFIASKLSEDDSIDDLLGLGLEENVEDENFNTITSENNNEEFNVDDVKGTENIQDRETGASNYLLVLMLGILLSIGYFIIDRKIG